MRILIAHSFYQQRGGEDAVVEAETSLLKQHGHSVELYGRNNSDVSLIPSLPLAGQTLWSKKTTLDISKLIQHFKPDVIHVHNTLPLISPSIYWAAARAHIPVVQTLHNFRLHCPQAMYLRNGKLCEDCSGKIPWRSVLHNCYRESKPQTAVLASMLTFHRVIGTWQNKVTRYIALNEFCRQKFIAGGLNAEKIVIKPNFVEAQKVTNDLREGFLFVGRLSAEKGVATLIEASKQLSHAKIDVVGTGSEAALLEIVTGINALGSLPSEAVYEKMRQSQALILPSVWYENFPRTLVEAFACGLPVIASRIGALAELVEDGVTGLLFEPGNADDLANKMRWAQQNPDKLQEMGYRARHVYEEKYTPEKNYHQLMTIYNNAIDAKKNDK